jgi:hypothetical protein
MNLFGVDGLQGGEMRSTKGMPRLLARRLLGTLRALFVAPWERASGAMETAWRWLPPAQHARRSAEEAAYERWKRAGGGAWLDAWWDAPEAACSQAEPATDAQPPFPGRMSLAAARRKLVALLALTVARGATRAEAATARTIAERLKSDYELH